MNFHKNTGNEFRYFVITIAKNKTIIARISEHRILKEVYDYNYTFDIYTKWKRPGAVNYLTFLDKLKLMVIKEIEKEKKGKALKKKKAKLQEIEEKEYDGSCDQFDNFYRHNN